jgi:hypothetical protein
LRLRLKRKVAPFKERQGEVEHLLNRSLPGARVNPFSTGVREKGVVHPRDTGHRSDLGTNDPPERAVLYLIEVDIEWIFTMPLIHVEGVIPWHTEVTSRWQAREHLDLKLILHEWKKEICAVLRNSNDLLV